MYGGESGFKWRVVSTVSSEKLPLKADVFKEVGAELVLDKFVEPLDEDQLLEAGRDADIIISWDAPFTKKVIEGFTRCRLIMIGKLGYENVDLETATEKGICVANIGPYCKDEVAEHTIGLLLGLARKIYQLHQKVLEGYWGAPFMHEEMRRVWKGIYRVKGKTLGIVGFGAIGRRVAEIGKGLGLNILAYDPYVAKEVAEGFGVKLVDFDTLVRESDFISIHCALTPETENLFKLEEFQKMKRTAYVINMARGEVIDTEALYQALKEGLIAGAGLDVVGEEMKPLPRDHPLYNLPNVIVTGHSAFFSHEAVVSMPQISTEEALRVIRGEWPKNLINKVVKEKFVQRFGPMREPM